MYEFNAHDKFLCKGIVKNQYDIADFLLQYFKDNNKNITHKEFEEKYGKNLRQLYSVL